MYIDRDKLAEELTLRECIQKIIKKSSINMLKESFPEQYQEHLNEGKLRESIRQLLPRLLSEEMSYQEMEELALSFVERTLRDHINTVVDELNYLEHKELQVGFIKRIYVSLMNDYAENREIYQTDQDEMDQESAESEEGEEEGDMSIKVYGPGRLPGKDDVEGDEPPILESDFPEDRRPSIEFENIFLWGSDISEVGANLTDNETMGWEHCGPMWDGMTKQIKKLHKIILNNLGTSQEKVVNIYEEWLYRNFEAHCKNAMAEDPGK